MSSRWSKRLGQALGLRLAAWYLGTFLVSSVLIGGLTYGLLSSQLVSRDHDIIQSSLGPNTKSDDQGIAKIGRAHV